MASDAELIRGLSEENRTLKVEVLHCRTEIKQLGLGLLIVNARLVVHRFGKPLDAPAFPAALEQTDRPMRYKDGHVTITASNVTRALRIQDKVGVVVAEIAYDGSLVFVANDFKEVRAHIRSVETHLDIRGLRTT